MAPGSSTWRAPAREMRAEDDHWSSGRKVARARGSHNAGGGSTMSRERATVHVDLPDLWPRKVTNMPNQRRRGFY
jgi:hypothetical protein